jgi:hypothetical protein
MGEERTCLHEIGRAETLGEPIVDRREQVAGLYLARPLAVKPRRAHGGTQLPEPGALEGQGEGGRWYLMFPISYRDLVLMLLDRGVEGDHTTISRWIQAYAVELEKSGAVDQAVRTSASWWDR